MQKRKNESLEGRRPRKIKNIHLLKKKRKILSPRSLYIYISLYFNIIFKSKHTLHDF